MKQNNLIIICFTKTGENMAIQLTKRMEGEQNELIPQVYSARKECDLPIFLDNPCECLKEAFEEKRALLFIGACGIAVRYIAPFIRDKFTDSPVLVMDEGGQFIIPVLSGHLGGANKIACQISEMIGALPVLTTATDVQGSFAVDLFAQNHDLSIANRDGIAKVSQKILEKKSVCVSISKEYEDNVDIAIAPDQKDALITLIPREYILGIGCRKGIAPKLLEHFVETSLLKHQITWKQIREIATIDQKKEEAAIKALSKKKNVPIVFFSAQTLSEQKGEFTASAFVKEQMGVDNVCERAAMAVCPGTGHFLQRKYAADGMTLSIVKVDWRFKLYEE